MSKDERQLVSIAYFGKSVHPVVKVIDLGGRYNLANSKQGGERTIDGVKVAGRWADPKGLLWPLFEMSNTHASCCKVKALDTVGGEYEFEAETVPDDVVQLIERSRDDLEYSAKDGEVTGWAMMAIEPTVGGKPYQLHHRHSHSCYKRIDGKGYVYCTNGVRKGTHYSILAKGEPVDPRMKDANGKPQVAIWLDLDKHPFNDYYGMPDIVSVITEIKAVQEAVDYNYDFLSKRGGYQWMMVFRTDAKTKPEETDALIQQIDYHVKAVGKQTEASSILQIDIGDREYTLERLDADMTDMSFSGLMDSYEMQIQSAHRVPSSVLGVTRVGALGGNLADQEEAIYLDRVIGARQRRWSRMINEVIKFYWGKDFGFRFTTIDTTDYASNVLNYIPAWVNNAITLNEFRAKIGEDPVDEAQDGFYDELMFDRPTDITVPPVQ